MANIEARLDEAAEEIRQEVREENAEVREAALEEAAAKVEAAETLVEELTLAALQTQIGTKVDGLEKELNECRANLEQTNLKMSLMETSMAEQMTILRTELTELCLAKVSPSLTPQPQLVKTETIAETITPVSPQQGESGENIPNVLPVETRRAKRFV